MARRFALPTLLILAAAAMTACAGGPPGGRPSYGAELDRLRADCRARDGILTPIPSATSGRPQSDYACEIRGGGSRIQN